jgi:hypothetical protein
MGEEKIGELSWRGKYRLRLAAGLLRAQGRRFDLPRDQFYAHLAGEIEQLPANERERLKALVDWVEQFDPDDALSGSAEIQRATKKAVSGASKRVQTGSASSQKDPTPTSADLQSQRGPGQSSAGGASAGARPDADSRVTPR